ncbi:signal peptidase I [Chloroflexota bacterium]
MGKVKIFKWSILGILALAVAGLTFIHFSPDYNMYLVRSESMKPTINMGDMIITGPPNGELKPATIVTYELGKALVTHRALSIDADILVTKGDALEDPDPRPVTISQVVGVYLFKIPNIGYLSNFMRTKTGWFGIVILPAMILVGFIVKDVVKEALREDEEIEEPADESAGAGLTAAIDMIKGWAKAPQQAVNRIRETGRPALATAGITGIVSRTTTARAQGKSHKPERTVVKVWKKDSVTGEVVVTVWENGKPVQKSAGVATKAPTAIPVTARETNKTVEAATKNTEMLSNVFEQWINRANEINKLAEDACETLSDGDFVVRG